MVRINKIPRGVISFGPNRIRLMQGDNDVTEEQYEELKSYEPFNDCVNSGSYVVTLLDQSREEPVELTSDDVEEEESEKVTSILRKGSKKKKSSNG